MVKRAVADRAAYSKLGAIQLAMKPETDDEKKARMKKDLENKRALKAGREEVMNNSADMLDADSIMAECLVIEFANEDFMAKLFA